MSTLQVNTIQTNIPSGVLAVRDINDALTAIQPSAVQGTAANTAPVFQDSVGTPIGTLCRAWVNFNGSGTVAIRAAFNVSSIVDNGVGAYTIIFATEMPTANYCAVSSGGTPGVRPNMVSVPGQQAAPGQTTTQCNMSVNNTVSDLHDPTFASVAFFI
jgi:hypothetical protein